jgi:hypothetical protein
MVGVITGSRVTEFTATGLNLTYGPILNWSDSTPGNYIVSINGIDQPPSRYSIADAYVTFGDLPPQDAIIAVRAFSGGTLASIKLPNGIFIATSAGDTTKTEFQLGAVSETDPQRFMVFVNGAHKFPAAEYNISNTSGVYTINFTTPPGALAGIAIYPMG